MGYGAEEAVVDGLALPLSEFLLIEVEAGIEVENPDATLWSAFGLGLLREIQQNALQSAGVVCRHLLRERLKRNRHPK